MNPDDITFFIVLDNLGSICFVETDIVIPPFILLASIRWSSHDVVERWPDNILSVFSPSMLISSKKPDWVNVGTAMFLGDELFNVVSILGVKIVCLVRWRDGLVANVKLTCPSNEMIFPFRLGV